MTKPPVVLASLELGLGVTETIVRVNTFSDGAINVVIRNEGIHVSPQLTLGQAIQVRDFLNRHIDELALQQTGSLAQRASDDPTQLAAVEEIVRQFPCDPDRGLRPGYLKRGVIDRVASEGDQRLQTRIAKGCGACIQVRESGRLKKARCGDPFGTLRDKRYLCGVCRDPE